MRKIIYMVLGALFMFGLLFLLWTWLFSSPGSSTQNNGQFGTASDTNQTLGTGNNTSGNGQINLNSPNNGQNSTNGTIPLQNNGTNGTVAGGSGTGGGAVGGTSSGSIGVQGVTWLTGATGSSFITNNTGSANGGGNGFTPTGINGINGGSIGGTVPTIGGSIDSSNSSNSQLSTLLASGLIGAASCALQVSRTTASVAGVGAVTTGAATTPSVLVNGNGILLVKDVGLNVGAVNQAKDKSADNGITFASCITNVLAKAALQQITASVVNWINSGFNGQPSFITNYQQFFTNVADLAAGQFIQGAGLSFLCSSFKLQIKVAIAQSYANRSAQSCSLTSVIKNVNSFMSGNFSQGGWPGFLSFTTMPTNNPYGAYVYGQIGLQSAQNTAVSNAQKNISPTGFLAVQKLTCKDGTTSLSPTLVAGTNQQAALAGGSGTLSNGCKSSITTPGTVIESSLNKSLGSSIDQLGLASSIDQILNALTQQLVVKTLQNGLSSLSGTTGLQSTTQTAAEIAAQNQAQGILTSLQGQITYAQQYGSILQGSIGDIESAQSQLNTLANCWVAASSSVSLTDSQIATASANAATVNATILSLNPKIDTLNNSITVANAEITTIQQLQSEALSVSTTANVATLATDYANAQATRPFIAQADVNSAQQDRTTLQSQMSFLNSNTATALTQCRAFGH